jgi:hypothetical protein
LPAIVSKPTVFSGLEFVFEPGMRFLKTCWRIVSNTHPIIQTIKKVAFKVKTRCVHLGKLDKLTLAQLMVLNYKTRGSKNYK